MLSLFGTIFSSLCFSKYSWFNLGILSLICTFLLHFRCSFSNLQIFLSGNLDFSCGDFFLYKNHSIPYCNWYFITLQHTTYQVRPGHYKLISLILIKIVLSWPENWRKTLFYYYDLIKLRYYQWHLVNFLCNIFWCNNIIISWILIYRNCVVMARKLAESFIPLLLFD